MLVMFYSQWFYSMSPTSVNELKSFYAKTYHKITYFVHPDAIKIPSHVTDSIVWYAVNVLLRADRRHCVVRGECITTRRSQSDRSAAYCHNVTVSLPRIYS